MPKTTSQHYHYRNITMKWNFTTNLRRFNIVFTITFLRDLTY